jgi:F-type H+-transporting ATPase subunit epsilon
VSAMAATLRLEIVTPEAVAFSEDVHLVTLPGADGQIGIYPEHVRLITQMVPGEMIITKGSRERLFAVGEGLVVVTGERVEILTDMAIGAEDIDESKVEAARQRAAARLQEKISDEELAGVNASLVRALAQLQVRRRRRQP